MLYTTNLLKHFSLPLKVLQLLSFSSIQPADCREVRTLCPEIKLNVVLAFKQQNRLPGSLSTSSYIKYLVERNHGYMPGFVEK